METISPSKRDSLNETLVNLILERLQRDFYKLKDEFRSASDTVKTRCLVIDDLLPEQLALEIYNAFPPKEQMRLMSSFRERKFTYKQLDRTNPLLKAVTFAIQDTRVVEVIEKLTGIQGQKPDRSLYAGGISLMGKGNFLNPHIDNSHDGERKLYRTLNLLYYTTPGWKPENGGNLELWDIGVRKAVTIPSLFNRLVLMETTRNSWHSVSPVKVDMSRCCVSNYYFSAQSPEPEVGDYFHVTSYSARPEQPFRRVAAQIDNSLRMGVRRVFRKGVGRRDVFENEAKHDQ